MTCIIITLSKSGEINKNRNNMKTILKRIVKELKQGSKNAQLVMSR